MDRQTDIMKLIVGFLSLAKAPKTAHFPRTSHNAKFRDHKMSGPIVVCTISLTRHVSMILQGKDGVCHPLA